MINVQFFPESTVSDHRTSIQQSGLCSQGQCHPTHQLTMAVGTLTPLWDRGRPSGFHPYGCFRPETSLHVAWTLGLHRGRWTVEGGREGVRWGLWSCPDQPGRASPHQGPGHRECRARPETVGCVFWTLHQQAAQRTGT